MSEHTKGPWKAERDHISNKETGRVYGNNRIICNPSYGEFRSDGFYTDEQRKERLANAHLISAAPEMYEALKECVESLVRYESCLHGYAKESAHKGNRENQDFWTTRVKDVARLSEEIASSIAKAEGKS